MVLIGVQLFGFASAIFVIQLGNIIVGFCYHVGNTFLNQNCYVDGGLKLFCWGMAMHSQGI